MPVASAMRRLLPLVLLLVLAGCELLGTGDGIVRLDTDQPFYRPGDDVELRLHNRTRETIGYNLCSSTLEAKATGWRPVASAALVCPAVLLTLEPGRLAVAPFPLPADLPGGTYRFSARIFLLHNDRSQDVVSNPFTVAR